MQGWVVKASGGLSPVKAVPVFTSKVVNKNATGHSCSVGSKTVNNVLLRGEKDSLVQHILS